MSQSNPQRLFWSIADSGMSSASNVLLTIVVARAASKAQFGQFSLVFATYLLLLSQSRALSTDVLLVRSGELRERVAWKRATSGALSTATIIGSIGGLLIAAVIGALSILLPGHNVGGSMWLSLSLFCPWLMLQDAWRNAHFARRQPQQAFTNDAVWVCAFVAVVTGLARANSLTPMTAIASWGFGGLVACGFGYLQMATAFSVREATRWINTSRGLSLRYACDNFLGGGLLQIAIYLVALVAGLSAAGAVRGALTLAGPFTTVLVGINTFLLPSFVSHLDDGTTGLLSTRAFIVGALLSAVAIVMGLALAMIPAHIGRLILGETWDTSRPLLLAATFWTIGLAMTQGPNCALRALRLAAIGLRLRIVSSAFVVMAIIVGGARASASGAMWGLTVGTCLGAVIWSATILVVEPRAIASRNL